MNKIGRIIITPVYPFNFELPAREHWQISISDANDVEIHLSIESSLQDALTKIQNMCVCENHTSIKPRCDHETPNHNK